MILDFIKDFLRGPEGEFQKLTPDYFLQQRAKLGTEEYAKWLKKQIAYYSSMARVYKEHNSLPKHWIARFDLLENEVEQMKGQGMSHIFPDELCKKISNEFKK